MSFLIFFITLIVLAIAMMAISDVFIKRILRDHLAKYDCKLISINDTDDTFIPSQIPPSEPYSIFMKSFLRNTRKRLDYIEVCFSAPGKQKITTLVAMNTSFFPSKIYFQQDLTAFTPYRPAN